MSVAGISKTAAALARGEREPTHARSRFVPGQHITLEVTQRVDDHHYLASFAGQQHMVESRVQLQAGSRVQVAVASVGERLELRYLGTAQLSDESAAPASTPEDPVTRLERQFAVRLTSDDRSELDRAMQDVSRPELMAAGGVYLAKLALPVDVAGLQSLYATQHWDGMRPASTVLGRVAMNARAPAVADEADIAEAMREALLPDATSTTTGSTALPSTNAESSESRDTEDSPERRSWRLLNTPDEGSVLYRYGQLPVLIGDELVELDLAYFRERRGDTAQSTGMRRMVMTFSTPALGRVEVAAHCIADRLSISIKADSPDSVEALATRGEEVKGLLARLGWSVDRVSYEVDPLESRAARHVMDHVLKAETLSRLV
jgi:hypothetical protein